MILKIMKISVGGSHWLGKGGSHQYSDMFDPLCPPLADCLPLVEGEMMFLKHSHPDDSKYESGEQIIFDRGSKSDGNYGQTKRALIIFPPLRKGG
jgi:hypothetical protein